MKLLKVLLGCVFAASANAVYYTMNEKKLEITNTSTQLSCPDDTLCFENKSPRDININGGSIQIQGRRSTKSSINITYSYTLSDMQTNNCFVTIIYGEGKFKCYGLLQHIISPLPDAPDVTISQIGSKLFINHKEFNIPKEEFHVFHIRKDGVDLIKSSRHLRSITITQDLGILPNGLYVAALNQSILSVTGILVPKSIKVTATAFNPLIVAVIGGVLFLCFVIFMARCVMYCRNAKKDSTLAIGTAMLLDSTTATQITAPFENAQTKGEMAKNLLVPSTHMNALIDNPV